MITIGITGGIGSGKTEVVKVWESKGAYVLNADDLAKNLMVEDDRIRREIAATFGKQSYLEDGSLNREYLAEQAFEKGRVEELNRIVHPRMPEAVERRLEEAAVLGYRVFVYEAALMLQSEQLRAGYLDFIVLVLAPAESRIRRVEQRDETTREQVRGRIDKQGNFENYVSLADYVIHNEGTLRELWERAEEVYEEIIATSTE